MRPKELIVPEGEGAAVWRAMAVNICGDEALTFAQAQQFDSTAGQRRVMESFGVASLDGFGDFSRAECAALGALLSYIELTQAGRMPALQTPRQAKTGAMMAIDAATRSSLELIETQSGSKKGALLAAVDRTATSAGARLLAARIAAPLCDPAAINQRLDGVQYFAETPDLRGDIIALLKQTPDIARAMSRLSLERGGPRDLGAIRDALIAAREIARAMTAASLNPAPEALGVALAALEDRAGEGFSGLIKTMRGALAPEPPMLARDGGFIAKDYDAGLDAARLLRDESRRVIAGLEAKYRDLVGVKSLKVRHNNVLGYFVETPPSHGDKLMTAPHDALFIHRQTLASAVRFTTGELAELDAKIARARDEVLARELELFAALVDALMARREAITAAAGALAEIDVSAGLAELAASDNYARPRVDDTIAFDIKGGRHPVVEQALRKAGEAAFIANDCTLGAEETAHLWLVTGPNMAGKSTFLRQNALIAILAQAGSFVPAAAAHMGVVDRVFSRVGAADDLARGRSTFMVEMVETAAILNQATGRSLVVLDEIGRGTSTFDGLSIAWAAVEHLHDHVQCRGLFATHYHELTALAEPLRRLENWSMKVREWKGDIVFLHEAGPGPADRSYGVAVAKLAGLPPPVLSRAEAVLQELEERRATGRGADLPLFAAAGARPTEKVNTDPLREALSRVDPDAVSAKEALDILYRLKSVLDDD